MNKVALRRCMLTIAFAMVPFFFVVIPGCEGWLHEPPPPPSAEWVLRSSAKAIVSDPSNWKQNSETLAQFTEAAVTVGVSDEPEVRSFKAAVLDLLVFATQWVDRLDEADRKRLTTELTEIVAKASVNAPNGPSGGVVNVDSSSLAKDAEKVVGTTIQKLNAERAQEFGKIYGRALSD